MKNLVDRFIKYIKIDSQSNPESETTPSTEKQYGKLIGRRTESHWFARRNCR